MENVTVVPFQLLQWKHAIRLEGKGLKHSSGRSVKAHAARHFGMSPRIKREKVLELIEAVLVECNEAGVGATDSVAIDLSDW